MFKQSLQQKLQQKMSPQQIQVIKLLEVPLSELEEKIKDEIENNPTLEEVNEPLNAQDAVNGNSNEAHDDLLHDYSVNSEIPSYKLYANNYSIDDEHESAPLTSEESFQDYLIKQLTIRNLDDIQIIIGKNIIGNIDPDGYLRRELSSIVDDMAFSLGIECSFEDAEKLLNEIQSFDPAGVGARSLQECLLLQLDRKFPNRETSLAIEIIDQYFELFTKKHYDRILKATNSNDSDLKDAINLILKLNPKPGGTLSSESKNMGVITPDFILEYDNDGEIQLSLNRRNIPELKISSSYAKMLEEFSKNKNHQNKNDQEASLFIRQKLDAAKWFIDAIKQREKTLFLTMSAILEFQHDYFLEGDETKIKPMILKDIAEITNFDISTISRVSNSKYIYTPYGMFPLKYFFSESMQTDSGDEVSTREIKFILKDILSNENKDIPYTDDKLTELLKEKGYHIARRTVAKYREQLNIPVARLRKEL